MGEIGGPAPLPLRARRLYRRWRAAASDVGARRYGGTEAPPIRAVSIEVTRVCNLRCSFCWLYGEGGTYIEAMRRGESLVKGQLTREEIEAVFRGLPEGANVYLAGGEPFARKDTPSLIETASSLGLNVSLTTNGTLLDTATIERLVAVPRLRSVIFSLDGPEDAHDAVRGKGNFRRTVGAAAALLGRRRGKGRPNVMVSSVMNPKLLGRVAEFARLTRSLGFDSHRIQHYWWVSPERLEAHAAMLREDFGIEDGGAAGHAMEPPGPSYGRAATEEILRAQAEVYPYFLHAAPALTPEEGERYYRGNDGFAAVKLCRKPWESLVIKADGTAYVCPDDWIGYSLGNVRESTVEAIWNGERARYFRSRLIGHGLWPGCAHCCALGMRRPG